MKKQTLSVAILGTLASSLILGTAVHAEETAPASDTTATETPVTLEVNATITEAKPTETEKETPADNSANDSLTEEDTSTADTATETLTEEEREREKVKEEFDKYVYTYGWFWTEETEKEATGNYSTLATQYEKDHDIKAYTTGLKNTISKLKSDYGSHEDFEQLFSEKNLEKLVHSKEFYNYLVALHKATEKIPPYRDIDNSPVAWTYDTFKNVMALISDQPESLVAKVIPRTENIIQHTEELNKALSGLKHSPQIADFLEAYKNAETALHEYKWTAKGQKDLTNTLEEARKFYAEYYRTGKDTLPNDISEKPANGFLLLTALLTQTQKQLVESPERTAYTTAVKDALEKYGYNNKLYKIVHELFDYRNGETDAVQGLNVLNALTKTLKVKEVISDSTPSDDVIPIGRGVWFDSSINISQTEVTSDDSVALTFDIYGIHYDPVTKERTLHLPIDIYRVSDNQKVKTIHSMPVFEFDFHKLHLGKATFHSRSLIAFDIDDTFAEGEYEIHIHATDNELNPLVLKQRFTVKAKANTEKKDDTTVVDTTTPTTNTEETVVRNFTDADTHVAVKLSDNAPKSIVRMQVVDVDEAELAKHSDLLKSVDSDLFAITFVDKDGKRVPVNESAEVTMPVDEGKTVARLIHFDPTTNVATELTFKQDGNSVTFTAPHFSIYGVIYATATADSTKDEPSQPENKPSDNKKDEQPQVDNNKPSNNKQDNTTPEVKPSVDVKPMDMLTSTKGDEKKDAVTKVTKEKTEMTTPSTSTVAPSKSTSSAQALPETGELDSLFGLSALAILASVGLAAPAIRRREQ